MGEQEKLTEKGRREVGEGEEVVELGELRGRVDRRHVEVRGHRRDGWLQRGPATGLPIGRRGWARCLVVGPALLRTCVGGRERRRRRRVFASGLGLREARGARNYVEEPPYVGHSLGLLHVILCIEQISSANRRPKFK